MAPPMSVPDGVFLELAAAVKDTVGVPVIAVGRNERSILTFVDFLARELTRTGVDVRVGAAGTVAEIERLKPDVVVLAAGASYRFPFNVLVPVVLGSPLRRCSWLKALLKRPSVKR
jgi:hypothetical protein